VAAPETSRAAAVTHEDECGAVGPVVRVSADERRRARCNRPRGHELRPDVLEPDAHIELRPGSLALLAKWTAEDFREETRT
jgi:hypothetical protein